MNEKAPAQVGPARMLIYRLLASLAYAAVGAVAGISFPVGGFMLWDPGSPGMFCNEYQVLLPLILAIWGAISGSLIGLIAGAVSPNWQGFGITCFGLGLSNIAAGIYCSIAMPNATFAVAVLVLPALAVEWIAAIVIGGDQALRLLRAKRPAL